jgi:hypothetical protein
LDKDYPKDKRKEVLSLVNSKESLDGNFDLSDFANLQEIYLFDSNLTSTDFLKTVPYPEKLIHLNIGNNNFAEQNLSFLEKFINLEEIRLGNYNSKKIEQGIYNRFKDSLSFLKNMTKLENIDISNTDIDGDW